MTDPTMEEEEQCNPYDLRLCLFVNEKGSDAIVKIYEALDIAIEKYELSELMDDGDEVPVGFDDWNVTCVLSGMHAMICRIACEIRDKYCDKWAAEEEDFDPYLDDNLISRFYDETVAGNIPEIELLKKNLKWSVEQVMCSTNVWVRKEFPLEDALMKEREEVERKRRFDRLWGEVLYDIDPENY